MEKEITTLQEMPEDAIFNNRRIGNTTRMIDHAIQLLFKGHLIHVRDHHQYGEHDLANKDLFRRILRRMNDEHSGIELNVDSKKLTIEIKCA